MCTTWQYTVYAVRNKALTFMTLSSMNLRTLFFIFSWRLARHFRTHLRMTCLAAWSATLYRTARAFSLNLPMTQNRRVARRLNADFLCYKLYLLRYISATEWRKELRVYSSNTLSLISYCWSPKRTASLRLISFAASFEIKTSLF